MRCLAIFTALCLAAAHPQIPLPPIGRLNCASILVSHQSLLGFPDMDFDQWPLFVIISNNPPGTEWRVSWMLDTKMGYLYPNGTGIYTVDDFRIHEGSSPMTHTANAWLEHRNASWAPWVGDGYVYRSAICTQ